MVAGCGVKGSMYGLVVVVLWVQPLGFGGAEFSTRERKFLRAVYLRLGISDLRQDMLEHSPFAGLSQTDSARILRHLWD